MSISLHSQKPIIICQSMCNNYYGLHVFVYFDTFKGNYIISVIVLAMPECRKAIF